MSFSPLIPPEATARSIDDLLRDVKTGRIRIPQFQRNFIWRQQHIIDLFDSIYRGYPIGSFLFWDTDKTEGSAANFGPMKFRSAKANAYLVIDGQQRLTTLVATLLRDGAPETPQDEHFVISFDLREERFVSPKQEGPQPPHLLPLNEVVDTIRYLEWLENLPRDANREQFVQRANQVARSLRDYKIPVYIVRSDDEEELPRIFERLNNSGVALKKKDIFNAITGKRDELDTLQANLARLGFGELDKDLLVAAIHTSLGASRGDQFESIRASNQLERDKGIADTIQSLAKVITFIQKDVGIPHIELLPYRAPLRVLARFFQQVPEPSLDTRAQLRRWLWRGSCNGRHEMNPSALHATLEQLTQDETASVQALTARFAGFVLTDIPFPRHDFRSKPTKLLCNVLCSLVPRHIQTGQQISIRELLEQRGSKAFEAIIPRRHIVDKDFEKSDVFRGTANRIFHPHLLDGSSILEALRGAGSISQEILRSHAIDEASLAALRETRYVEFLESRELALKAQAALFLGEMCEI